MIEFWLKYAPNFRWSYGCDEGMRPEIAACVKRWRERGANTAILEVRSPNGNFSGSLQDFVHGFPTFYVWPAGPAEEVTVDYYLAGVDSPSYSHWIVPR